MKLNIAKVIPLTLVVSLTGCFSSAEKVHDFVKDVEGKAYDRVAGAISKYCGGKTKDGTIGRLAMQEALELRREIRQRGSTGPVGPTEKPELLDDKTAHGPGPVVRIYCDGERVPVDMWEDFIRIK